MLNLEIAYSDNIDSMHYRQLTPISSRAPWKSMPHVIGSKYRYVLTFSPACLNSGVWLGQLGNGKYTSLLGPNAFKNAAPIRNAPVPEIDWTVATFDGTGSFGFSFNAKAAASLQNSALPAIGRYSLSRFLLLMFCSAFFEEWKQPIKTTNRIEHRNEWINIYISYPQNWRQHVRLTIIIAISSGAQIDFFRICIAFKCLSYTKNCIWRPHRNTRKPLPTTKSSSKLECFNTKMYNIIFYCVLLVECLDKMFFVLSIKCLHYDWNKYELVYIMV